MQAGMLSDARFLQSIFAFSQNEKDFINDETVELMAPYLELEGFNPAVARNASKAAEGLCTWCRAMTYYHEASKASVIVLCEESEGRCSIVTGVSQLLKWLPDANALTSTRCNLCQTDERGDQQVQSFLRWCN